MSDPGAFGTVDAGADDILRRTGAKRQLIPGRVKRTAKSLRKRPFWPDPFRTGKLRSGAQILMIDCLGTADGRAFVDELNL